MMVIVIFFLFVILDAWVQSVLIKWGTWINHLLWAVVVTAIALGMALIQTRQIYPFAIFFFFLLSIRWLVFDIALNLFRGKDWLYAGTPDKNDSFIDSLPWGEHPGWTMLFIKVGLLVLFTLLNLQINL
jgi:hypothetical protein